MTHAHGSDAPSGSDPVGPREAEVLGPDGADHRSEPATTAADEPRVAATDDEPEDAAEALAAQIEQPAKVMRIGTMIKQLLEEVRAAPLDEAGRRRLAEIHASSIRELESGLSPDLREELARLTLPFTSEDGAGSADGAGGTGGAPPSESELRIAQAQLVGWLEGLFHGIQTALFAQQMAARAQLEEMRRRALPPGVGGGPGQAVIVGPGGQILGAPGGAFGGGQPGGGQPGGPGDDDRRGTGQYL